jgi:hypothetical protein
MSGPSEGADDRADDRPTDAEKAGWAATLEELAALADERREAGWSVVRTQAGNTAPEPPDAGDTDRFGLVHVVPGDDADELTALFEDAEIDEFESYRRSLGGTCYLITELRDTERRDCVLVASAYDVAEAGALADHAAEVGHVFTRFQRLDGELVAEVRHDAYEKLLPRALFE